MHSLQYCTRSSFFADCVRWARLLYLKILKWGCVKIKEKFTTVVTKTVYLLKIET